MGCPIGPVLSCSLLQCGVGCGNKKEGVQQEVGGGEL